VYVYVGFGTWPNSSIWRRPPRIWNGWPGGSRNGNRRPPSAPPKGLHSRRQLGRVDCIGKGEKEGERKAQQIRAACHPSKPLRRFFSRSFSTESEVFGHPAHNRTSHRLRVPVRRLSRTPRLLDGGCSGDNLKGRRRFPFSRGGTERGARSRGNSADSRQVIWSRERPGRILVYKESM